MIRIEKDYIALETAHTGYYIGLREGLSELLYYGEKLDMDEEAAAALREKCGTGYGTDITYRPDDSLSLLHLALELSPAGKGDYRRTSLDMELGSGSRVWDLERKRAGLRNGSVSSEQLPTAYGGEQTLTLTYEATSSVRIVQYYTVYPDCDVITRRQIIENRGSEAVVLNRALSYQLDLQGTDWEVTSFTGAWARERHPVCTPVAGGAYTFGSTTGVSSHYCNPFFMVSESGADEERGDCYGFNLIYSGNHEERVEAGPYGKTRVSAGISPEGFRWTLAPGEAFETPEAMLTFSAKGMNGVSRAMHAFIRNHIVRGAWAKKERPVLVNNWEATYFDFSERKLLKLAESAAKLGAELFVLDDGWFGARNSDKAGLGDYNVNRKKLPSGLDGFAEKLRKMGLSFGLWMEPEMVNPDSDLYRAHPDWAVHAPGTDPVLGRNQLVLDLCRTEVQDYLIEQVDATLNSAKISYVKWDMNRPLADCYSASLKEQGRFAHTWELGFYRVLGEVTKRHPKVLFEACASGGNRFDPGMLCYMPQIWTSDNTDAWERMQIQTGSSYGYPQSVMGCHVSASPNHQTLRCTPLESRFDVAAFGLLGYELDLTQLTSAERKTIAAQIAFYKDHRQLLQFGQMLRVRTPFRDQENCVWVITSADRSSAMVFEGSGRSIPNAETQPLRLTGLVPGEKYRMTVRKEQVDIRTFGSLINTALPVKVNASGMLLHAAASYKTMETENEQYCATGRLLMKAGVRTKQRFIGTGLSDEVRIWQDYSCRIWTVEHVNN